MEEISSDGINLQCPIETSQPVLTEDFFYTPLDFYEEIPFDPGKFRKNQSFLAQKVKEALQAMEDEIKGVEEDEEVRFLSSTFQVESWRTLISRLEDSLRDVEDRERLAKNILECAVTFYKELMDPIRSIQQFDYLLHLSPDEPEHWSSYGLCLIEMSEQCLTDTFDMEKRSVLCFIRAARLSLAHLLADDDWLQKNGHDYALRTALEHYYNASDAFPNLVAKKGIFLVRMLNEQIPPLESLREKEVLFGGEDITREVREILTRVRK